MRKLIAVAIGFVAFGAGCSWLEDTTDVQADDLRVINSTITTGSEGFATFRVDITDEDTLLASFNAESPYLTYISSVTDPNGNVVVDGEALVFEDTSLTGGIFLDDTVSVNYPIIPGQSLSAGEWKVKVGVTDQQGYYVSGANVEVGAQLKHDDSFETGVLNVDVVYVGDAATDTTAIAAIEQGVLYWKDLYAQIGIDVQVNYLEYDGANTFPAPGYGGDQDYIAIAEESPLRAVNLVVVEDIEDGDGLYGLAGGIPGPLLATPQSGVAVSIATSAGPDLEFSDEEIGILGETLAHEVGHFTGLFHPVEASFDAWDALDDTPQCRNDNDCTEELGANLMFPYPVCYSNGCIPQDELTNDQGSVSNRYTAVR